MPAHLRYFACAPLLVCAVLAGCGGAADHSDAPASAAAQKQCEKQVVGAPGRLTHVEVSTVGQVQDDYRTQYGHDEPILARESGDSTVTLCTMRIDPGVGTPAVSTVVMAITESGNSTWVDGQLAGVGSAP
jgi:hypothetical protein